jgi:hypothetical protein
MGWPLGTVLAELVPEWVVVLAEELVVVLAELVPVSSSHSGLDHLLRC